MTVDQSLTIYYPSGVVVCVFGRFLKHGTMTEKPDSPYAVAIELLETTVLNKQVISAGSIALVDPRCVVDGSETGELYSPRKYCRRFPGVMKRWMDANKDWPRRLRRRRKK